MIYLDLTYNLALLVALGMVSGFIESRWSGNTRLGALLQGILFGGASVLGMLRPVILGPGIIVDGRSILVSLCALFFGPWATAAAAAITVACRTWLGGTGMITGWLVIVSSAAIGLMAHFRSKPAANPPSARSLYVFGLAVHAAALASVFTLPEGAAWTVLTRIGLPVMLLFPLATLLVGKILSGRTEAKRVLRELQGSNDLLRAIIEAAPTAIIGLDLDGKVQSVWNPAAEKMLGWSAREAMGRPLPSVPTEGQEEFNRFREMIRNGMTLDGVEVRRQRRDGTPIDYSIYASPLHDAEGRIIGNIAVLVDITERKQMEQALTIKEQEYRTLVENLPDLIVRYDAGLRRTYVNPAWVRASGLSAEEVVNIPAGDIPKVPKPTVDEYAAKLRTVLETGTSQAIEFTWVNALGSTLFLDYVIVPEYDRYGKVAGVLSVGRDLTERKRAEQIMQARLRLMQFADTHTLEELLQATLDEAEALTGSTIGFYHFVADDEKALTLQAWSTNTIEKMCTAEGKGLHYSIDKAGVWVDCIRERRPVIHNDYPTLPHRRGMPKGHAPVVRELVTPVFRGDKIVAVLGVGNKPAEYDQYDVKMTGMLADLAWTVAERKRAETALEESEAKMRSILDNIGIGVSLVSPKMEILELNRRMREWFPAVDPGQRPICYRAYHDPPRETACDYCPTRKTLQDGLAHEAVTETPQAGVRRNYRVVSSPLFSGSGEITAAIEMVEDITESKRAEEERQAHLRFFKSMDRINRSIQATNDLERMMGQVLDVVLSIFDCDRAYLLHPCDPKASSWSVPMERTRPEYPGVLALGMEMPMNKEVADTFRITLDSDGPVKFGPETPYPIPPDVSERFHVKSFMSLALHPKVGKPWQFGIHQCSYARVWTPDEEMLLRETGRRLSDALTSLLAYRNLRESEMEYRRIVDTANEGIWVVGPDLMTVFVNPRMAEMIGFEVEQIIGRPLTAFMFEEDVPDHHRKMEARRRGLYEQYERRFRRKDGKEVWTLASAAPVFDAERKFKGAFAMFNDITERRQAEEEIRRLNLELEHRVAVRTAELEAANKELEAFAYSVSHDLRAPLRHIDGFLELLQKRTAEALDEKSRHYMDTISESAKKMETLIEDLLSFSRMGRYEMAEMQVDVRLLVGEVIRDLEADAQGRDVRWRIGDLPVVIGDRSMLRIVLVNLISNALKFTRPRECAEIEIGSLQDNDVEVRFFVKDNGVGFDMDYADNLFGVFQRLHRADEFEGTGIGLANVRRIIGRHGGRTWAEGRVNQGATFFFSLPRTGKGVYPWKR